VNGGVLRLLLVAVALAPLACGGADTEPAASAGGGGGPHADRDGDHLTDAEEAELGTDPSVADTDGDGYLDGDEVLEGTDPLDAESRIYQGGWPYLRDKDDIADPGFDGAPEIGKTIARLVARDQFGDRVDLYDFARHGKKVVIDLSAVWCAPCKDLGAWLEGEPSNLDDKPEFAAIPDLVRSGEIFWLTVVFEDAAGNPATPGDAAAWAEAFPNPKIPVVADNDRAMYDYLFPGSFPSIQVVDEDMTLRAYDRFDYETALASLLE
jgi:hypothetical protein